MKVFISWSGSTSKAVAEALRGWLPKVIQAIEPWASSEDIEKGTRWSSDIAKQLEDSKVGIICLTPDNLMAPWLLFEAGALSKTLERTFVCPYLFNVEPTDLTGPLAQFQATQALEEGDAKGLIETLNRALGDNALSETNLNEVFAVWWPRLKQELENIPLDKEDIEIEPQRDQREMIEEALELVRNLGRDVYSLQSEVGDLGERQKSWEQTLAVFPQLLHRLSQATLGSRAAEAAKETGGQLIIDSAKYGAGDQYNDVTNVVKSAVTPGGVEIPVNNDWFRPDPAKGVPKELKVTYFYGGRRYSKTVSEGATLLLP